jgi:hypothetical protein
MMEKENWKDDIFRSLDGIQRAEPSPMLFDKIRAKTKAAAYEMQVVRRPYLALAAACLALLIMVNVRVLTHRHLESPGVSVYQVDNANFDLYDYH